MKKWPCILSSLLLTFFMGACGGAGNESAGHNHDHSHSHNHNHEDGEEGEEMDAELTESQMKAVGITLGGIERKSMADALSATGQIEVDARSEAVVTSKVPGTVTALNITVGQKVGRGQVVAYVESPEAVSLQGELRAARQEVDAARREVERQEALAAQGAGVRKNLDNARAQLSRAEINAQNCRARLQALGVQAENSSARIPVKADISGVVVSVDAAIGAFADMQVPIARIVDTSAVYCSLQLFEKDINKVRPGMAVDMQLTNDPAVVFRGKVQEVTPAMDPQSRSIPVKVSVTGVPSGINLVPGMSVSAQISLEDTLCDAVPEGAVISQGGKSFIFVLESEGTENGEKVYHFEKVEVVAGATSMGYTAVTPVGPMAPDARIVTSGAFYINSMVSDHGEHNH